ncbi:hypothetical protein A5721_23860 [Mycobacterium vulneris]|nr:hypothetical protein A5721_23860 [Mycolicibacterium vulneris]
MIRWWRKGDRNHTRIADAERREAAAAAQAVAAERLAAQSRRITDRLRHEVEKNHWTELLQRAWEAR